MSNLEKIKDACISANPEIMGLKYGCEVKNWLKGTAIILQVHKYDGESDCYDVAYYKLPEIIVERTPFNNWEILGRPIRLADVLLAIPGNANKDDWFIDTKGDFWRHGRFVFNGWNLKDDNLEHQSEETVNFIAELL